MRSSPEHAVKLEGVSKRFLLNPRSPFKASDLVRSPRTAANHFFGKEPFWALDDVSLEIAHGETVGIIGHNGSGKSTLLRTMVGISPPTRGTVEVNGRYAALLELGAGFHPSATGRENAYVNALFMGLPKAEAKRLMPEIIEFAGLGAFIDQPMKTYSSGMYVRLGFSVAVHVKPEILVIDEVLAVGDAEFQGKCFDHFQTLKNQGTTIILVTHVLGVLESFADRVIQMERGKLKAEGDAAKVVNEYMEERINSSTQVREQLNAAIMKYGLPKGAGRPDPEAPVSDDVND